MRFFSAFLKNPISVWLMKAMRGYLVEYKNRKKMVQIGYLADVRRTKFGKYCTIYNNVVLSDCEIGDYTYVAQFSLLGNTRIGKFCSIGPEVLSGLGRHPVTGFVSTHPAFFSQRRQAQITFADASYFDEYQQTTIGNDVWIGARTILIDGVSVGDGAIVAAGSIVTKDVPSYAIVGGTPAKLIKFRFSEEEVAKLIDFKWWDRDADWIRDNFRKFHDINNFLSSN